MRRFLVLLITTTTASSIAAAQPATVEPLAPGPPPEMTFVTLDRFDAISIGGLSLMYLQPNSKTFSGGSIRFLRLEANAQYVDAASGFGGYIQAPFAYGHGVTTTDTGSSSATITSFGDIEAGGIFVPKLSAPDVGVVIHAGLTAPTAEDGTSEQAIGLFESFAMLRDIYDAIPKGVTLRVGVSPTLRRGNLFLRADLGLDWNLTAAKNLSVGKGFHFDAGAGLDFGKIAVMLESANIVLTDDKSNGSSSSATLDTLTVSMRADVGVILPYVGVIIPLEEDTSNFYDFAVIAGADFKL